MAPDGSRQPGSNGTAPVYRDLDGRDAIGDLVIHLYRQVAVDDRPGPYAEKAKDHARWMSGVLARRLSGMGLESPATRDLRP